MSGRATPSDGRVARRLENRERIVEALFALIIAGHPHPTLREIASEAGVTSRTLLNHFPDLGALLVAALALGRIRAAEDLPPLPEQGDPEQRVRTFFAHAAAFLDRYAAVRWAALTFRGEIPGLSTKQRTDRAPDSVESRLVQLVQSFGVDARKDPELSRSLSAAVDPLTWRLLRVQQGLSPAAAAAAMARTVVALTTSAR